MTRRPLQVSKEGAMSGNPIPVRAVLAVALVALLGVPQGLPAGAAVPGSNGKIAFVSSRDGNQEVYVMDPDGSNQTDLTRNPAADADPAWAPDGSRIAFASNRDGDWEIFVMDADGSHAVQLTHNSSPDTSPSWSPDGTRIAFATIRGRHRIRSIYVMDADGSHSTPLVQGQGCCGEFDPAWSPEGTRLALAWSGCGPDVCFSGVDVTDAEGRYGYRVEGDADIRRANPSWSPDGLTLAMDDGHDVSTAPSTTANQQNQVVSTMLARGTDPAWSPNGQLVALVRKADIQIVPSDGSGGATNLTNSPGRDREPDWQTEPGSRPQSDLSVEAAWGESSATLGATAELTLSVAVGGPDAAPGVFARAILPDSLAVGSAQTSSGQCYAQSQAVYCALGTMASSDTATITVEATVLDRGRTSVAAGVSSGATDPAAANDSDAASVTGVCTVTGTRGADVLKGANGDDSICGLGGNDRLIGGAGDDILIGGPGGDTIVGGPGADRLVGGGGADTLKGRDRVEGNDILVGGPGPDVCRADPLDTIETC
jgi:dipeptidyl aminopeptidase/acylaminoacyl peptidase